MSDVVFDTDLQQRSLVEASAGTGKTYALAGLFARAVIVDRLRVPQILAVTYTVAATEELQQRVRLRLKQAVELASAWREGDPQQQDGDAPETGMLRRLLHEALHAEPRESLPALRQRLSRALREMDLAVIATIHGFCQRVLREHALDTQQPLATFQLETDATAQREKLATDLWRALALDPQGIDYLTRKFRSLDNLARDLKDLLASEPVIPFPLVPIEQSSELYAAHVKSWEALQAAFCAHGNDARSGLIAAVAGKAISSDKKKRVPVEDLWEWFEKQDARFPSYIPKEIRRLTTSYLSTQSLKGKELQLPQSPLFDATQTFVESSEACDLQRLHELRAEAFRRSKDRKQAFNVRDYDDLIGELHEAVNADTGGLVTALRSQFPCVLVDEFQDTDARQWEIFARLFGDGSLVLVGDPKQAIYRFRGGDVNTYVAASHTAQRGTPLDHNFRSRPCVIRAVNTLFQSAPAGLLGEGINFLPTQAGGKVADADFLLDQRPAPAIHFHVVPPRDGDKDWTKPVSVQYAADLCADAIVHRLRQAQSGNALLKDKRDKTKRALLPRDFAVLVREHSQASAIRHALSLRGVPAVASGRESLYQGEEVQDLLALLLALRSPGDDRRLRAVLATPLLGLNAANIAALDEDGDALRQWQQQLVAWRTRWERHGPQAMLADVLATHAERLLQLSGGERRLTNYLQLAELMQSAAGRNLGTQGQVDALRHAIAHADGDNEAQQPRLESDAGRVQILTLHKSKGLEFPLVYLPFIGIGRQERIKGMALYTDTHGQRVRQCETNQAFEGAPSWAEARQQHFKEEGAEDMRLLYVGLTRASEGLWVCGGHLSEHENSSLARLLMGSAPAPGLIRVLGDDATLSTGFPAMEGPARLAIPLAQSVPAPRIAQRRLYRNWWIHSFSQLHKQQSHGASVMVEARAADDEAPLATSAPLQPRQFGGSRFGNVLHHALEHVDFAAWREHAGMVPPVAQRQFLIDALNSQGYAEKLHETGVRELTPLVANTLNTLLPEHLRLCDLDEGARLVELEFHLALRGATTRSFLELLHQHGLSTTRNDFGSWTQLSGLLNGKIDLTYRHEGRVYVMDYKSNDLPAYDQAALAQTMASSEYDLQALLYTLAVHRWMQLRLGHRYDYERDFGGVRYVFCRGLDSTYPSQGIFVPGFSRELVEAVDDLLVLPAEQAA